MASKPGAGQHGQYERAREDIGAEVSRLAGHLRARSAEIGEREALTELAVAFAARSPAELAGLLTAALAQLAAGPSA